MSKLRHDANTGESLPCRHGIIADFRKANVTGDLRLLKPVLVVAN